MGVKNWDQESSLPYLHVVFFFLKKQFIHMAKDVLKYAVKKFPTPDPPTLAPPFTS